MRSAREAFSAQTVSYLKGQDVDIGTAFQRLLLHSQLPGKRCIYIDPHPKLGTAREPFIISHIETNKTAKKITPTATHVVEYKLNDTQTRALVGKEAQTLSVEI